MEKIVFLWDIDGTLLLTGGAGGLAFEDVFFELYGVRDIWSKIEPDGRTDDSILEEIYFNRFGKMPTVDEKKQIEELYTIKLPEALKTATRFHLMPHVPEVLAHLHSLPHVSMGLATGNYERAAHHKLVRAGLRSYFDYGGYGSDSADREVLTKLAFERAVTHLKTTPKKVVIVGDTIHDVRCGKAIGAETLAVCTGRTKAETLQDAGATWVIPDLSHFPEELLSPPLPDIHTCG